MYAGQYMIHCILCIQLYWTSAWKSAWRTLPNPNRVAWNRGWDRNLGVILLRPTLRNTADWADMPNSWSASEWWSEMCSNSLSKRSYLLRSLFCLSVCLSVCLSLCLPVCLCVCVTISLSCDCEYGMVWLPNPWPMWCWRQ